MRRTTIAALALAVLLPLPSFAGTVTVKSGDTLSDIADRYGISVGALMRMNGLRDANHVEVGQTLQVPGPRVVAGSGRHTVRSGDTLSGIAARYRVSEKALIALNNLPSADHVELGATLRLPSNAVLPKPKPKQAPKPKPVAIKANPNATAHTVASGQTLTQIAKAYDVPVATLIQLNDLTDPNKVTVGTKLMLRGTTPKPNPSKQTVEATQPAPKAQATQKSQTAKAVDADAARPVQTTQSTQTAKSTQTARSATTAKPTQTAKASPKPTSKSVQPKNADWRTYGPLQVDWANWQSMGGSDVAPTLNSDGKPLYIAVNCAAKKINVTGADGSWKSWSTPKSDFENDLVKDRCKSSGG